MAQDNGRLAERLNALIALEHDAVDDYRAVLRHVEEEHLRERLRLQQAEHERHVHELAREVSALGGTPPRFATGKAAPAASVSSLAPMGTASALRALLGEERLGCARYREALDEAWPDAVRTLLERHLRDEQAHVGVIEEAIRERPWGQAPIQLG